MYLKLLTTDSATNTVNGVLILIMLLILAASIYCFYRLIKRSKQNNQYIEESGYKITDELGDLKVDKNNSVWWVKSYFGEPKIRNFNEVIDYELVVNDSTVEGTVILPSASLVARGRVMVTRLQLPCHALSYLKVLVLKSVTVVVPRSIVVRASFFL